jgi:hypothetical protein
MTQLTGANLLAKRKETKMLLPLSKSEMQANRLNWLCSIFAGHPTKLFTSLAGKVLVEAVLCGSYPKAVSRATLRRHRIGPASTSTHSSRAISARGQGSIKLTSCLVFWRI